MPRGGARIGAGRPRGFARRAEELETLFYKNADVEWGWIGDRLICQVASGEYAQYLKKRLLDRMSREAASEALYASDGGDLEPMRTLAATVSLSSICDR
ncbi:MAG: hypothetical protein KME42_21725 [Tildeniella nuda ZEHNDER 1965/U140]|jgi:hypothetical protein|nr:hypothetical protein [Tildeniella nuda ZEHNDER 1965/U140]